MTELFLIVALALPPRHFQHAPILPYHIKSEEEDLIDIFKIGDEYEDVFIHENPQTEKLKENGWERFPVDYFNKQIWIKRKPRSDRKSA